MLCTKAVTNAFKVLPIFVMLCLRAFTNIFELFHFANFAEPSILMYGTKIIAVYSTVVTKQGESRSTWKILERS